MLTSTVEYSLVVCSNKRDKIGCYDLLTGQLVNTLRGHYELVKSVRFHPTQYEIYSTGNEHQILVFSSRHMPDTNHNTTSTTQQDQDEWSDED